MDKITATSTGSNSSWDAFCPNVRRVSKCLHLENFSRQCIYMSTLAKFSFNHTRELLDLSPKGIKSEISKLKCQHIVLSFVTKINSASYIWTLYGMRNFFEIPTTQNTHTLLTRGGATRNFLERQNWTKRHECKVVETSVLKRYQKRATQNSR